MNSRMDMPPDWVLTGWRDNDGGYWVLASLELTYGELRAEAAEYDYWPDAFGRYIPPPPVIRYELTVGLSRYVLVTASPYGEAMAGIFGTWDPDRQAPPDQIANARRALGDH